MAGDTKFEDDTKARFREEANTSRKKRVLGLVAVIATAFLCLGSIVACLAVTGVLGRLGRQSQETTVTSQEFHTLPVTGVLTGTEEGGEIYYVPDARREVSWPYPREIVGWVQGNGPGKYIQSPVGSLPPETWVTVLGDPEGGLLPVEITLEIPEAVIASEPDKIEVRFQDVANRPSEREIQAYMDWVENGLIAVEHGELLLDPSYKHGKVTQIEAVASWDESREWRRVYVHVWVVVGLQEVRAFEENTAPEFIKADYPSPIKPGEESKITAFFHDKEGDEVEVEWEGCEPRERFTCLFTAPSSITSTQTVSITVSAWDEKGADSVPVEIPITIEVPLPPTPTPAPQPTPVPPTPTPTPCQGSVYVVKAGEWLMMIARRHPRVEVVDILRETNARAGQHGIQRIYNPNLLKPGQRIWIPGYCP